VADPEPGEDELEGSGGEGGAVVSAERELARLDLPFGCCSLDERDRLLGAAAQLEVPADDLSRVAVETRK
jgi:hypothetical protein